MTHLDSGSTSRTFTPAVAGALLLALGALSGQVSAQPVSAETADLNDDGIVNILDYSLMGSLFGRQAGQVGYREGLDLVPDGVIDFEDLRAFIARFGSRGVATSPTVFRGRVFDGLGNPLPGATVRLLNGGSETTSGVDGNFFMLLAASEHGQNKVTFDGSTVGPADDPTPGLFSGLYPTIPNKPVFINGGKENVFRDLPLPERDLTGSVPLLGGANADVTPNPDGSTTALLFQNILVDNVGVTLHLPAGCELHFVPGEDPTVSITKVDPASLPVPMPPLLSSSLFVTYQPGGSVVETCPPLPLVAPPLNPNQLCLQGFAVCTEYDNDDGFDFDPDPDAVTQADLDARVAGPGPFVAGIIPGEGVFDPLAGCIVVDQDNDSVPNDTDDLLRCGPLPLPFEFAWYHTDIRPPVPCARTTVTGTVRRNDVPMTPIGGVSVGVPGVGPVLSLPDGSFAIPNVPAGPNGPRCFSNPFSLRANASAELNGTPGIQFDEYGSSNLVQGVPGGVTDVGDIKLGVTGTVQGRVLKLSSISPFTVVPLADGSPFPGNVSQVTLDVPLVGSRTVPTDAAGNFGFSDVPSGPYSLDAHFDGTLPVPGGGTADKVFDGTQFGVIDFPGDLDVLDFRFTSTGSVKVTVLDENDLPIANAQVQLNSTGGDVGGGFIAPSTNCNGQTDANGMLTFDGGSFNCFGFDPTLGQDVNGVPMGACQVTVFDPLFFSPIGSAGEAEGCFINQHGQLVELTIRRVQNGDIDLVRVENAVAGVPVLTFLLRYTQPLLADSFSDVFITVEADVVPGVGGSSEINQLTGFGEAGQGPTDLDGEVDLRLQCSLTGASRQSGPTNLGAGECLLLDADFLALGPPFQGLFNVDGGSDFPDGRSLGIFLDRAQLDAILIGLSADPTAIRTAIASQFVDSNFEGTTGIGSSNVIFGPTSTDIVPNFGSVNVDVSAAAPSQDLTDPVGDVIPPFFGGLD